MSESTSEDPATRRMLQIRERLIAALSPEVLEVADEGHLHQGHEGARDGRGHFYIRIQAARLDGLGRVAQHRLIYQALGDLLVTDIHAVRVDVRPPNKST
jgi:BolA protein